MFSKILYNRLVKVNENLIGIILLAAGASTRLGEPKQFLRFQGETLLRRTAKIALKASDNVVVVLGAKIEDLQKDIEDLPIQIIENKNWKSGMSSSIKIGLQNFLNNKPEVKAVIVMVCDQPFVDENLLNKIIEKFQDTDSLIVASEYQKTLGVPALFSAKLFSELLALNSQKGAKQLIKKYRKQTIAVSFPDGAFDVDTPIDFENLIRNFSASP